MIAKICLMLIRFALSFWVGAAVLFVITSVAVATTESHHLTSPVQDVLVTVRFPFYYLVGWSCLGATLLCTLLFLMSTTFPCKRMFVILLLATVALIAMVVDYHYIYQPLVQMVTPPGTKPRTMKYMEYHEYSKQINMFDASLCLMAAILACYPFKEKPSQAN